MNPHLVCPVCLDVLDDPAMAPCGHNCCMNCWYLASRAGPARAINHSMTCPVCRQQIQSMPIGSFALFTCLANITQSLKKNLLITQIIDDWPTKCHWDGCTTQIRYCDRDNHFRECPHKLIPRITFVPSCDVIYTYGQENFWCDQCNIHFNAYQEFRNHVYGDHDEFYAVVVEINRRNDQERDEEDEEEEEDDDNDGDQIQVIV